MSVPEEEAEVYTATTPTVTICGKTLKYEGRRIKASPREISPGNRRWVEDIPLHKSALMGIAQKYLEWRGGETKYSTLEEVVVAALNSRNYDIVDDDSLRRGNFSIKVSNRVFAIGEVKPEYPSK
jgi:hypothetical protein